MQGRLLGKRDGLGQYVLAEGKKSEKTIVVGQFPAKRGWSAWGYVLAPHEGGEEGVGGQRPTKGPAQRRACSMGSNGGSRGSRSWERRRRQWCS